MATTERISIADFYEREVLPALQQRLDTAFPEFAWQPDARGWHAANEEFTHATLGARANRVVCHGDAPRGFLVHGQGPMLWTTYVNDGQAARGRDFVDTVRQLAERAGIDAERLDRPPTQAERKANLLHDAFVFSRRELASERGAAARDNLEHRGIPPNRVGDAMLGVVPPADRLRLALAGASYRDDEIAASGLLADSRWPGRIVGAWSDERSRVVTLWARAIDDGADERYLYLRGEPRVGALPYGMSDLLTSASKADRAELTLVEGVMDVPVLRANGVRAVVALGGASVGGGLFERLADHGVERIVLAFDNDDTGRAATVKAIDASVRSPCSPDLWVVDPDLYGSAKDPGDVVRAGGPDAWHTATAAPSCAVTWRALDLTGPIPTTGTELGRRAGMARAGAWLGCLPPRLAIEQTAALDARVSTTTPERCDARSARATGAASASRRHHESAGCNGEQRRRHERRPDPRGTASRWDHATRTQRARRSPARTHLALGARRLPPALRHADRAQTRPRLQPGGRPPPPSGLTPAACATRRTRPSGRSRSPRSVSRSPTQARRRGKAASARSCPPRTLSTAPRRRRSAAARSSASTSPIRCPRATAGGARRS